MYKMLAIAGAVALCGSAWAAEAPDRSALSYDENVTINSVCATHLGESASSFHGCVAAEVSALRAHPTPDRSGLSPSRSKAVERQCEYLRRDGVARYNDCLRRAVDHPGPAQTADQKANDEVVPNYARVFADDGSKPPPVVQAAAVILPSPGTILPARPEHVADKALTPAELFKKVERSVFIVLVTSTLADGRAGQGGQGSAVAISEHLLLTNCHVVKNRPIIKILQDQRAIIADATVVAADDATDRCVIESKDLTLVPITGIRTVESLTVGERVFAVGSPLGLERTLSEGLVSGIRSGTSRNLVQTSAPLSPGSSGGGLFDEHGNLVGITTLASRGVPQNLNFAIAASDFWR
jgi:S1-C subfamily serine protease